MKHNITAAQRRRIIGIIHFFRNATRYTKCTSVRVLVNTEHKSFVSVVVKTRRSDCHKYSPRQVMTAMRMHGLIGKRGGLTVASAEDSLRSNKSFVRTMLHAS